MSVIGKNLEQMDLSGSFMSSLTDLGLKPVAKYCNNLQVLALSLLRNITGLGLLPLLQDPERAANIKTLLLSCRQVRPNKIIPLAKVTQYPINPA